MENVIFNATGMRKRFQVIPSNSEFYADKVSGLIRDYVRQANANGVVIGMSGGLDSAVSGALCARSGFSVHAVLLPCGDNMATSGSKARALEICDKFGWKTSIHDIAPGCLALRSTPEKIVKASPQHAKLAEMNLQARLRVAKLREIAQLENRLVLGTDNLTELILGYFTKDGNGCDLRPLALFTKRELYLLAQVTGVPPSIIDAVPSAELFSGQTDEGELGFTYRASDDFLLNGTSGDPETDMKILRTINASQHKRTPPLVFMG